MSRTQEIICWQLLIWMLWGDIPEQSVEEGLDRLLTDLDWEELDLRR
jgi:hypothetical protein